METHLRKAIALQRSGDLSGAIREMHQALRGRVQHAPSYHFLAALEEAGGQLDAAYESIQRALELDPRQADYWYSAGNLAQKRRRMKDAVQAYQRCIELNSNHVHAQVNLALLLQRLEQWEAALAQAERAVTMAPAEVKAWLAVIGTLGYLRRFEQGQQWCDQAEETLGERAELMHMRGNLLVASGDFEQGEHWYRKALALAPESVPILVSLGDLLAQFRNARDALPLLQKALALQPGSNDARHRLGTAYLCAGFPTDAVQVLLPVVQEHPELVDAFDGLILAAHYLDGTDEAELFEMHRQWARFHAESKYPKSAVPSRPSRDRLRIGFVSPDFRNHSVSRFMTPLLRELATLPCEVICYSDVKRKDAFSDRLEMLGGSWVFSYALTDDALAERIRNDAVDVLVDLVGHTGNHRLQVFARKPAPLQISWLGYPNTTGLQTIDYRLTDAIADPEGRSDALSSERLVRLPDGFHCFEAPVDLPLVVPLPAKDMGYLTFGSFNNQAKINELTLRRWARVMEAVPGSRLVLKNHQLSDARNQEHWRKAMDALGLDLARVEMIGFQPSLEQHYQTYGRVDIALDSFPYNGTTTTCEALWMGVPVLTILGDTQRSRTGASLLTHAGLADWVAQDEAAFVQLACQWSNDLDKLESLRLGLRAQLQCSPLGDGPAFARKFLHTVQQLWEAGSR